MNEHITYKELLALVPQKIVGRAPSLKYLRENDTPIAISKDGTAICYESGFACYSNTSGTTVFSVRKCRKYTYDSNNKTYIAEISEEQMLEFEWYIPVMMYGESRIEHNQNYNECSHRYEFDEEESIDDLPATVTECDDAVLEMCKNLTERQRTMVILNVIEKYTHAEIAQMLGVKRCTVSITINNALKSIKKFMESDEI